jgi:hypothetical protein
MAIAIMFESPEWTAAQYDRIAGEVMPGGKLLAGMLAHIAGNRPDGGFRVVEVWESAEAAQRFAQQTLIPTAQRLNLPRIPEPQVWNVHKLVTG